MQKLTDRSLIHITGVDAENLLQNIVTSDVRQLTPETPLQYGLILGPQGRVLFDFFLSIRGENGYLLDCGTEHKDALIKRLSMYKLRAKVDITPDSEGLHVYATQDGLPDPRSPATIGGRLYTADKLSATDDSSAYVDACVAQGVPLSSAIHTDKDYPADLNLDILGAINWAKGCFIGQETVARMHHKGRVKRRLFIISGKALQVGMPIVNQNENEMGTVRMINTAGTQGLSVLKIDVLEPDARLYTAESVDVEVSKPAYLP
ncbi:MAG: hypothetical protein OXT65_10945 [Alphaproteobacteria bacterium]|nr:hypothetical protein [Alphaproteobacteria bacterium]